jgi:hypothetical protein
MTSPVPETLDPPADVATIPLPETRRTDRARQKRQRRRQRRRRGLGITAALVVGALLAAALVGKLVSEVASGGGGTESARGAVPAATPPGVLLAQRTDAGHAVSLVVLVPAADGKGGTLLLLPPGVMAEVASLDVQPLGQVLSLGGPERLRATVQNLLGAAMSEVHVVDDAGLSALVAPGGAITVDVPERVERVDGRGTVEVVFPSGPVKVGPADVPRLLAEPSRAGDLNRLARHQAFFEAWLGRLGRDARAVPDQPPGLKRALVALASGPVVTRVLPVDSLGTTGDGQLYQVDREELAELRAAVFPSAARSVASARPTVQILNGTGAVQVAQRVADKLGTVVEVKLTGNAARFDYAETQIVFYDKAKQAQAERVRAALGMGRLVLSRNPLDVVDVTIIVGKDFK